MKTYFVQNCTKDGIIMEQVAGAVSVIHMDSKAVDTLDPNLRPMAYIITLLRL
jgi:hypothetical protein